MQRAGTGKQIEGLEDEADFFVADGGEVVVFELADQASCEPVLAGCGRIQAANQIHERGFSRAGRTHDGDVLAAIDGEIDAAQGGDVFVAHAIGLGEAFGADGDALVHQVLAERVLGMGFDGHLVICPQSLNAL